MGDRPEILLVKIELDGPQRIDRAIAGLVPREFALSRTRIAKLIRCGAVSLQGETVSSTSMLVQPGSTCRIELAPATACDLVAEDIPLEIAFEDRHVVVVNKPAGLVVHPGAGHPAGTLVNGLMHYLKGDLPAVGGSKRPGIVHRLDMNTSGLIAVAKTDRAMHALTGQLASRQMTRVYTAVVRGVPDQFSSHLMSSQGVSFGADGSLRVDTRIGRHVSRRTRQAVRRSGGKPATTRLKVVQRLAHGSCSMLRCQLETGRTHQIRVHAAHIGHPIVGDDVYGAGARILPGKVPDSMRALVERFPRQALHARQLAFDHPESCQRILLQAALPKDMQLLVDTLSA